jgi:hypothetical protein
MEKIDKKLARLVGVGTNLVFGNGGWLRFESILFAI